jgi:hypothetical protein
VLSTPFGFASYTQGGTGYVDNIFRAYIVSSAAANITATGMIACKLWYEFSAHDDI